MRRTDRVTDIRRVSLKKQFRTNNRIDHSCDWHAFGYYDFITVERIDPQKDSYSGELSGNDILESIWNDSLDTSTKLEGVEKIHTLYGLTFYDCKVLDEFWKSKENSPIFMVTIIHSSHDNKSKEIFFERIEDRVSRIDDPTIKCIAYFSLDCSDVILFWLSASYTRVMIEIDRISQEYSTDIHDTFSVCAYNPLMEREVCDECENGILTKWEKEEGSIDSVQIHLHGTNLEKIKQISCSISNSVKKPEVKSYFLAGQEDILVNIPLLPVKELISLFVENGPLDINNMVEHRIICRTGLGIDLGLLKTGGIVQTQEKTCGMLHENTTYAVALFDMLRQASTKLKGQIWFNSLCKLLNELSNAEISTNVYDIYVQEIYCHYRFVEYILQMKDNEIPVEYSDEVRILHRYIRAWSQMSFHAMHLERQLTQTTDVNRLYMYPAKLCLFYSALMYMTALSLMDNVQNDSISPCSFFLAPTLVTDPQFVPVQLDNDNHVRLVLGELPSELLFKPRYLIPTLIHEAAHYVGRNIRGRSKRAQTIEKALICRFLSNLFQLYVTNGVVDELEWEAAMDGLLMNINLRKIDDEEASIEYTKNLLLRECIESIRKRILTRRNEICRSFQRELVKKVSTIKRINDVMSRLKPPFDIAYFYISEDKIKQEFEYLYSACSEGFSDICMIEILELTIQDYLDQIVYMLRIHDKMLLERDVSQWKNSERFMTVVATYMIKSNVVEVDKFGEFLDQLLNQYIKGKFSSSSPNREMIVSFLSQMKSIHSKFDYTERTEFNLLVKYLRECRENVRKIVKSSESSSRSYAEQIRQAYLCFKQPHKDIVVLYKECRDVVRTYIDMIKQELDFKHI